MNLSDFKKQIKNAQKPNLWDHGNALLYKLCQENFSHTNDETILTKTLFIGRIYAAAIERRKKHIGEGNDNFYRDKIIKIFKESDVDERLSKLKYLREIKIDNILTILQTHNYLLTKLESITALKKRSFCSKYLHFHLPDLYFIFDSRSVSALRKFKINIPKELNYIVNSKYVDKEYATFYCKCLVLKENIKKQFGVGLTTRQLDILFIELANIDAIIKKNKLQ